MDLGGYTCQSEGEDVERFSLHFRAQGATMKLRRSQKKEREKMKTQTAVIMTENKEEKGVLTRYRLLCTFDAFEETEVFSVFLTTRCEDVLSEDFVYDIARDRDEAICFFRLLCENRATACHLIEIAENFLAGA